MSSIAIRAATALGLTWLAAAQNPDLGPDAPGFKRGYLKVDEGVVSYLHRAGTGPALVLIPGSFSDAHQWDEMIPDLPVSWRLVLVDLRGHGHSWPPPGNGSIEQFGRDVAAVADQVGIRRFYAGGHSIGGMVALELGRAFPDRIQGIVSMEGWTHHQVIPEAFSGAVSSTLSAEQENRRLADRRRVTGGWTDEQRRSFAQIYKRWDGSEFLRNTPLPVLEIYGDRGKPRPPLTALRIPGRRNIEVQWLAGASHNMTIEWPHEVAGLIVRFIAAFDSTARPFDAVVVGATPGGIAAAITAARLGRSVALTEYHPYIGAMSSSGLSRSDVDTREAIGGLFREFTGHIRRYYVDKYGEGSENVKLSSDGYYFEPHVALQTFDRMVAAEKNITVFRSHGLEEVHRSGKRVVGITMRDRNSGALRELRGLIFVDGTYEGDLAAYAGVRYRVGREPRTEFNELHAGVVFQNPRTKAFLAGTTGEGDHRLQAYTYRLSFSDDPANGRKLTEPPEGYDRARYAGYLEDVKAGRMNSLRHANTVVRAFTISPVPNRKYDANMYPLALSYPFAELNEGYADAAWDRREEIAKIIRNVTLGLLWFMQNDPEVPEQQRALARQYNLAKDEFTENGNFPWQLYVREARRIIGEYTLTENDICPAPGSQRPPIHPDSIAAGEYPFDSMPVRRVADASKTILEGYVLRQKALTRPYQVPYRILLPLDVESLLVPVAASATHIAFSSLRMEPAWMTLGQAAGVAAHLALARNQRLRDLRPELIQRMLLSHGQVLTYFEDMNPSSPAHAALQYLGTKGFFEDYRANPDQPLDRKTLETWSARLAGLTKTEPVPVNGTPAEWLKGFAARLGVATGKGPGASRGDFCQTVYLLLEKAGY